MRSQRTLLARHGRQVLHSRGLRRTGYIGGMRGGRGGECQGWWTVIKERLTPSKSPRNGQTRRKKVKRWKGEFEDNMHPDYIGVILLPFFFFFFFVFFDCSFFVGEGEVRKLNSKKKR